MSTSYGQESADDTLEKTRNNLTEQGHIVPLPEDNDPPAAPSKHSHNDTVSSRSTSDHPLLDDINDPGEVYEEGEEGILYKPYTQRRPPGRVQ